MFGFQKARKGNTDHGALYHEYFIRGEPELARKIIKVKFRKASATKDVNKNVTDVEASVGWAGTKPLLQSAASCPVTNDIDHFANGQNYARNEGEILPLDFSKRSCRDEKWDLTAASEVYECSDKQRDAYRGSLMEFPRIQERTTDFPSGFPRLIDVSCNPIADSFENHDFFPQVSDLFEIWDLEPLPI